MLLLWGAYEDNVLRKSEYFTADGVLFYSVLASDSKMRGIFI
jgi:hypothetical protein